MSSKSPLGDAFLAFVLAAVAGCERSVPQKPAVSAPIVPTTAAPSAVPAPSASTSESRTIRRYWKRVDVPSDTEWWAMVLDDRTLVLLSPELARVLPVTDVVTSANGTTFNVRSRDGIVPCTIEATEAEEDVLRCPLDSPNHVTELRGDAARSEAAHIDERIRALTPPADACERAERCCKAAWTLLVPGESCNVDFQLGRERYPDTCVRALEGFRKLLAAKRLPPVCQ